VRHGVLAFLCALSFVLYIDRVCLGQAVSAIKQDLKISNTRIGFVTGAFTIAYCIFEVPTGWLGDRYGSRGVLTRIVVWWSAFTALTGAATNFYVLVATRFLFGAGEAGAFPNVARVTARWFPAASRGRVQGMIVTSAQLGGAAAPVLAAYLIGWVGWRLAFAIFGALGIVWAVAFYLWFRDDPSAHPNTNEAERQLIGASGGAALAESHPPIPWAAVFTSANVWLLGGIMTSASSAFYMYITWCPEYLKAARGVGPIRSGYLSGAVLLGGALGSLAGGWLADWAVRLTGERKRSRRYVGFCGMLAAAGAMRGSIEFDSPALAAASLALACFCVQAQIATWWATVIDISGKHVAALFGLMNSMGLPGAFGSQVFLGRVVDILQRRGYTGRDCWDPAFDVYTLVLLLGACCWLMVNAEKGVTGCSTTLTDA
jgi:MFS family permease